MGDEVWEVFQQVLTRLGTFARDTWDGSAGGVGAGANDVSIPEVSWPFVCERGHVNASFGVSPQVGVMRSALLRCIDHTYIGDDPKDACKRHPVVDPGILAAWKLGGAEAVNTSHELKLKGKFDRRVYGLWDIVLLSFVDAVKKYDAGLATDDPAHQQFWAEAEEAVPLATTKAWSNVAQLSPRLSVKIRPGARRSSRKRGL